MTAFRQSLIPLEHTSRELRPVIQLLIESCRQHDRTVLNCSRMGRPSSGQTTRSAVDRGASSVGARFSVVAQLTPALDVTAVLHRPGSLA